MRNFLRSLGGLRGRLILTYTLTTVLALLALEMLFLGLVFLSFLVLNDDRTQYIQDAAIHMSSQAKVYLQPGQEDLTALQDWLDVVYALGYASPDAQGILDSPAAAIERSEGIYVLSPEREIMAYTPRHSETLIGRPYTAPELAFEQGPLTAALADSGVYQNHYLLTHQGTYRMAVPVFPISGEPPVAVIVLTIEPAPPLYTLWPSILTGLGILFFTGLGLLIAVTPFGALFGFIMSRNLTRRLANLARAADAWSEGDFTVLPQDRSRDEIGHLGMRMQHMAERIQFLLQTQQELAMMEERNRLARDLHDTVKQQTFATLMQLRAAKNRLETDPAGARAALEQAETQIKAAQQDLGLIIAEMRPAALEGEGLAAALEKYLAMWSQHTRIPAQLKVEGERRLPLDVEQTLYRVAQEALSNVARHSGASGVKVRLAWTAENVRLEVQDNGCGFDPQEDAREGFGLQSMRQRLEAHGGALEVHSLPDDGATMVATIPLRSSP